MIKEFVEQWEKNKDVIEDFFKRQHPEDYSQIVMLVIQALHDPSQYDSIDPNRIHEIDDGNYQGTLVYVIGSSGYQPSDYWCVMVDYGSCSGCDTLEGIRGYSDETPTEEQVKSYMMLALHIVQNIVKIPNPMYPEIE